jgi:tetratricopeptide (TPR) repeat protein
MTAASHSLRNVILRLPRQYALLLIVCWSVKSVRSFLPSSLSVATQPLHYSFSSAEEDQDLYTTATTNMKVPTTISTIRDHIRRAWLDQSLLYYSKVMREERRRALGQLTVTEDATNEHPEYITLAEHHYFALRKVKDGKPHHAERIYRRILQQLQRDEAEHKCDQAPRAVTTLLLALHMQRTGDAKKTRAVFVQFLRDIQDHQGECACSAKVLQAFALFEMKQGNELKSLELVQQAIGLDPSLQPILNWQQFRRVQARRMQRRGGLAP